MRHVTAGTFQTTPRMRELVNQVLDTNRISYGPMCREFEQRFASIHDCEYGVLSNSGTSSLQVALQAMKELHGWQDGDEVIIPSVTFVATLNIVLHNRMKPVIVDVEPELYGIDALLLPHYTTGRTRAIIPVHLFGMPCDMNRIMPIARLRGLKVIADSCESMFVQHHNRMVGSIGDIGCFSTYMAHLLPTGVGGIATTNELEYAARMRSLVNHGRHNVYISMDDDDGQSDAAMKEIIPNRLRFPSVGHSFRITELEAALGLAQLDDWESMIKARNLNAKYLTTRLQKHEQLQLPKLRPETDHAFMMYPIVLKEGSKQELVQHLEKHGIETRDMLPLTNQPAYSSWLNEDDFPVAKWINRQGLYCGIHQGLSLEDLDWVAFQFERFFESH